MNNKRIVTEAVKIDLHIHSELSNHKDSGKIKNSWIKDINLLVNKLDENGIGMAAITDHDAFSFDLYEQLSKAALKKNIKILPGVEFTVNFDGKPCHIVTIFDDKNIEKIENIESVLKFNNNRPEYDVKNSFSEEKYANILSKIDIDAVLIAHQKAAPKRRNKNDVSSLDNKNIKSLMSYGYLDSLEVKNWNRANLIKDFIKVNRSTSMNPTLITGSDCHSWTEYPKIGINNDANNYLPTFMKSLPTFKGLKMAVTEKMGTRFSVSNDFYNNNIDLIDEIKLTLNDKEQVIPMSRGINVIIGGNSSGKSFLLHRLTGQESKAKDGYDKFEKKFKFKVKQNETVKAKFDSQSSIREIFESGQSIFETFGQDVKKSDLISKIEKAFIEKTEYLIKYLRALDAFSAHTDIEFTINTDINFENKELVFRKEALNLIEIDENYEDHIEFVKNGFDELKKQYMDINFEDEKLTIEKELEKIVEKIKIFIESNKTNNKIIESINKVNETTSAKRKANEINFNIISDEYKNNEEKFIKNVSDKYFKEFKCNNILTNYEEFEINIRNTAKETILEPYKNIYKLKKNDEDITLTNYIDLMNSLTLSKCEFNEETINLKTDPDQIRNSFANITKNNFDDKIIEKVKKQISKEYVMENIVVHINSDSMEKSSQGLNSKKYFEILTKRMEEPVYIIDQPEDDISPKAIKDSILKWFKDFSKNKQVIIVTHNPQFIINLDVDNVIFIEKNKIINIMSGSLEYEEDGVDMMKIIADNIDGGKESINMRWNRYKGVNDENTN